MTYQEVLQSLRKKEYQPVYFLHGPESYYIDLVARYLEQNVLTEGERAFNQLVLYGKDSDARSLIDTASRYPMMAPYQLVLLKEAQDMRSLTDLLPYIQKPVPTTILAICFKHKKFDKRTKFAKAVQKHATVMESKKLYDNKMPDWIQQYLREKKLQIEPAATHLIAEYLGTDLSKVANELDKLAINLAPGTTVNPKIVQDNIGISKDYNVFELQNALGSRNIAKAQRIVRYFIANPKNNPLVVVIGALYNFFSKVYIAHSMKGVSDRELSQALGLRSDFFLRDYKMAMRHFNRPKTESVISVLREYDLKSKGVDSHNTPPGELLREMVYKILN